MITTQHIQPTYRPPANHWLRMIVSRLREIRCLQTCVNNEVEVITAQVVPTWGEYKASLPINSPPSYTLGMTMSTQEVTGTNPYITVWFKMDKLADGRISLKLYSDDGFDSADIVQTYDFPSPVDDIQMDYTGQDFSPGRTTGFKATFHNVIYGNGDVVPAATSYEFYIRKEMVSSADPTVIAPENPLAKMTTVTNIGNYQLEIYEGGGLVAIIPPFAPPVILPMPGILPISAKVSAGQPINEGQYGEAKVERNLRCLCGEKIIVPVPEPVGGLLV